MRKVRLICRTKPGIWQCFYVGFGFRKNNFNPTIKRTHLSISDSCTSYFLYQACTAWTGGNDMHTEGQFVWDHWNTTIGFSNWSPNNPSKKFPNQAQTHDCIDLYRDGTWNDRPCLWKINCNAWTKARLYAIFNFEKVIIV